MPSDSQTPPHLLEHLDDILPIVTLPRFGVVVDFDGTLSEFAPTPDEAIIYPTSKAALGKLVQQVAVVAVVSGRGVRNLRDKVDLKGVMYAGNHGAEYIIGDNYTAAPRADEYRERIVNVFNYLKANMNDSGLVWDDKLLSVTVHYRLSQDRETTRRKLEFAIRTAPGIDELEVFWGNMVLEIRAPIGLDKGYAVRKLVEERELDSIIFLGDDTTDIDALIAVNELSKQGRTKGIGVAVIHEASPKALIENADYRLESVAQTAEFLQWISAALA